MSRKRMVVVDLNRVINAYTSDIEYLDQDAAVAINERKVFDMMICDALRSGYHKIEQEYRKVAREYAAFGIKEMEVLYVIGTTVKTLEQLFEQVGIRSRERRCNFVWKPSSRSVIIFEED